MVLLTAPERHNLPDGWWLLPREGERVEELWRERKEIGFFKREMITKRERETFFDSNYGLREREREGRIRK